MMANFKKQTLRLIGFPIFQKSANKNHKLVKRIASVCMSYRDYELVVKLLASGYVEITDGPDMENFIHRLGKVVDIKFTEEVEKLTQ